VHVEAHLLDRIGNVGSAEGEVLESPSQTAVGSRVMDGGPHVGGDLGLSVRWVEGRSGGLHQKAIVGCHEEGVRHRPVWCSAHGRVEGRTSGSANGSAYAGTDDSCGGLGTSRANGGGIVQGPGDAHGVAVTPRASNLHG
jgi:hypothetical protein